MDSGVISDKILSALMDSLSVDELEAILAQKKTRVRPGHKPKPMTETQQLKAHYRKLMISMGIVHPSRRKL